MYENAILKPTITASLTSLRKERDQYLKAKQAVVFFLEGDNRLPDIGYTDLTDTALNMKYDLFDPDKGVTSHVLEKQVERGLYRTHSQCLCGDPGIGKTLFHIAKTKMCVVSPLN